MTKMDGNTVIMNVAAYDLIKTLMDSGGCPKAKFWRLAGNYDSLEDFATAVSMSAEEMKSFVREWDMRWYLKDDKDMLPGSKTTT